MSEESPEKVSFPIDTGNILNDLFFTWMFPLNNFFRVNKATESNLFELPKRLDYDSDLKNVRKVWKRLKKSKNPNIFFALWKVLKYEIFKAMLPVSISYNIHVVNSLMIGYIIKYINGQSDRVVEYIVIYSVLIMYNTISTTQTKNQSFSLAG